MEDNLKMRVNGFYPDNTMTLTKARLNLKTLPTLREFWKNIDDREKNRKEKHRRKARVRINNFSILDSPECDRIKSILSPKYSKIAWPEMVPNKNVLSPMTQCTVNNTG